MRFICDSTLGKLTKYLRILGFDAVSINNLDVLSAYENLANPPLLFTRRRKTISYQPMILIKTNRIEEQIKEIESIIKPYITGDDFMTHCIECNALLESTNKADIEARVPEYIYHHHEEFKVCPSCKKVYWEGTHTKHIKKWTNTLKPLELSGEIVGFPFQEMMETLQTLFPNDVPAITKISQKEQNDPYLVLIGTLLSLRTKDETTEIAMEKLTKRAKTPQELLKIPEVELQKIIYPVGFYRNKSRTLRDVSEIIIDKYGGQVPDSIDELLTIKGVGRKTANLVITEGFGKPGICVDTHVHRISNRLGIVSTRNPHETEESLRKVLPGQYWIIYNTLLVTFGKRVCKPISPLCSTCELSWTCKKITVDRHR